MTMMSKLMMIKFIMWMTCLSHSMPKVTINLLATLIHLIVELHIAVDTIAHYDSLTLLEIDNHLGIDDCTNVDA